MEAWRKLAIELFPEYKDVYSSTESVFSVLSDLEDMVDVAHLQNNEHDLARIYKFTEWCYSQKNTDPDIWDAAATTFYEHLLDSDLTLWAIPYWVKPDVFKAMRNEFETRMGLERRDTEFYQLLDLYNKVNGTDFD